MKRSELERGWHERDAQWTEAILDHWNHAIIKASVPQPAVHAYGHKCVAAALRDLADAMGIDLDALSEARHV